MIMNIDADLHTCVFEQLPPHVNRYLQPFDASIQEIADIYKVWLSQQLSLSGTRHKRARAWSHYRFASLIVLTLGWTVSGKHRMPSSKYLASNL